MKRKRSVRRRRSSIPSILSFFVLLVIFVVFWFEKNNQISQLQQRIEVLESQQSTTSQPIEGSNATQNSQESRQPNTSQSTEGSNVTQNLQEEKSKTSADASMLQYLKTQANSDDPKNWLEVAKCDLATEEILEQLAINCVNYHTEDTYWSKSAVAYLSLEVYWQKEIATAISLNESCTFEAMYNLAQSKHPEVWFIVASSDSSGVAALEQVAINCANYRTENTYWSKSAAAYLSLEVYWQETIATTLYNNRTVTNSVMSKLVVSKHPSVVSIGHQWIKEHQ